MSDTANRFPLKHPIVVTMRSSQGEREETVTEVTLTPLTKVKQLRILDHADGEVAKSIALLASLTGLTVTQVDEMHPEDFEPLLEKAQNFPMPGRSTGRTSSAT